jgi:hypothetical protein
VGKGGPKTDRRELFPVLSGHLGCFADTGDPKRNNEKDTDKELGKEV